MTTFKELNGQVYTEIDIDDELDYTFNLDAWCAARGVALQSYEIVLPTGSAIEVLADQRSGNKVTVTVMLSEPAPLVCGRLVDGVTCRFVTTPSPRSDRPLRADKTMWFMSAEH